MAPRPTQVRYLVRGLAAGERALLVASRNDGVRVMNELAREADVTGLVTSARTRRILVNAHGGVDSERDAWRYMGSARVSRDRHGYATKSYRSHAADRRCVFAR